MTFSTACQDLTPGVLSVATKFIALSGYPHGFSLLEGEVYHIIKDFFESH